MCRARQALCILFLRVPRFGTTNECCLPRWSICGTTDSCKKRASPPHTDTSAPIQILMQRKTPAKILTWFAPLISTCCYLNEGQKVHNMKVDGDSRLFPIPIMLRFCPLSVSSDPRFSPLSPRRPRARSALPRRDRSRIHNLALRMLGSNP